MNDSDEPQDPAPPKKTVREFVALMTKPFELNTEGLGVIVSRSMTMKGAGAFDERLKSIDDVDDATLVRAYMGCVSGIPTPDDKKIPEPLSEEQSAKLTDADVLAFAHSYLLNIAGKDTGSDPLGQMAAFIREERAHHREQLKKTAETIRAALNLDATAGIMKQWPDLSKIIQGSIVPLQEQIAKVFGPTGAQSAIGNAIRDLHAAAQKDNTLASVIRQDRQIFDAVKQVEALARDRTTHTGFIGQDPFRLPELPPPHKTPIGRTAIAVERLQEVGQRMEEAMGYIVKSAGEVAELVGKVSATIKDEAHRFQEQSDKQTQRALWFAKASLVVSTLAILVGVVFSVAGYFENRVNATATSTDNAKLIQRLEAQNALTTALIDEQRKQREAFTAAQQAAEAAAKAANGEAAALRAAQQATDTGHQNPMR